MVIGAGLSDLRRQSSGTGADEEFALLDRAVRDATELTRSLLSYGRRRGSDAVAIPIDRFVLDSKPLLRALLPRDIELAVDLDAASAEVRMESSGLHQILVNLVANAGTRPEAWARESWSARSWRRSPSVTRARMAAHTVEASSRCRSPTTNGHE